MIIDHNLDNIKLKFSKLFPEEIRTGFYMKSSTTQISVRKFELTCFRKEEGNVSLASSTETNLFAI